MKPNFRSHWLVVLGAIGILFAFEQLTMGYWPPSCSVGSENCGSWTCTPGNVIYAGTLSKTNDVICVGGSVTAPSLSGTTIQAGHKTRQCVDNCGGSETEIRSISYNTTNTWWEPPLQTTFTTAGTYSFTIMVQGVSSDSDCPSPTPAVSAGTYTVTVANNIIPPVIAIQPVTQTVPVGNNATFSVSVVYCGSLTFYQWRKNGNELFNIGNFSGADTPQLTIQSVSLSDIGSCYDVVVRNPAGSVTSSSVKLWVSQPGVDSDGDGLPDSIDAYPNTPDTTLPTFTISSPAENQVF
jgi:hypothetical protein